MQQLPDVEDQFRRLGTTKTVSQSQEVEEMKPKTEVPKDDESSSDEDDKEGLYTILFQGAHSKQYKARYFDAEGFTILDMTAKKLEVKKKRCKSCTKKQPERSANREPVEMSVDTESVERSVNTEPVEHVVETGKKENDAKEWVNH